MASNEHGAIEQNVEHHETNNSIYYTRETELHAESYGMMKSAIRHNTEKDLAEKEGGG